MPIRKIGARRTHATKVQTLVPQPKAGASMVYSPTVREDTSSKIGGYLAFTPTPSLRFAYYQQMSTITPHVSTALNKLGLSITKGMTFHGRNKKDVKEFETWAKRVNFIEQVQTSARILCRDGVYLAAPMGRWKDDTGNGKPIYKVAPPDKFKLAPFYMQSTTLLPVGFDAGQKYDEDKDIMLQPEIDRVVINENDDGVLRKQFDVEDVVYGTYNAWNSIQRDIMGRLTFGIYGASLMDPIEVPLRNYLNLLYNHDKFIEKYGSGRYNILTNQLQELVDKQILTPQTAQSFIDDFAQKHKNLRANEDIVSFGIEIKPIEFGNAMDIIQYKESLEIDIALGLLQSPITMGKAAGSTYASAYMVEEDRLLVMEGLQKSVENQMKEFINLRLAEMNKPLDSVWIEFDELSKPKLTCAEVQNMYNTGVISKQTFQRWAGFQEEDIIDEIKEKPELIQEPKGRKLVQQSNNGVAAF